MQIISSYGVELRKQNIPIRQMCIRDRYKMELYHGLWCNTGTSGNSDVYFLTEIYCRRSCRRCGTVSYTHLLVQSGDYYRLINPFENNNHVLWQFVSKDKKETVVCLSLIHIQMCIRDRYGTSMCYPVSSMGSHVSVVPNHQLNRKTPLHTKIGRAHV